jgi:hypothetical protein
MQRRLFMLGAAMTLAPLFVFGGEINLPQTGQTKCYDAAGAEIACAGTGQDGEIQAGISWPDPRFTVTYCDVSGPCANQGSDCDGDGSNDVVTDNLTGLMWTRNGNPAGTRTWNDAIDFANGLTLCGYSDWRLPSINELESLVNAQEYNQNTWLNGQGFTGVLSASYWSSTTLDQSTNGAWLLIMWGGRVDYDAKTLNGYRVLPVRNGQADGQARVWKTGQTTIYRTGDDGDLQKGVSWPDPRFIDHGDGAVSDSLTGLMWTKEANAPGPAQCAPAESKTWQEALDYVRCLNTNQYLGHYDWRLPNRKELRSLEDYENNDPTLPTGHPFTNTGYFGGYWSSTTLAGQLSQAWFPYIGNGSLEPNNKTVSYYVWPVRTGEVRFLTLNQGWNFISLPRVPPSPDIAERLANLSIIWGYDNVDKGWKVWKPGGTANTLSSVAIGNGYWLYMVNQAAIDMSQWTPVSSFLPASVYPGWNLIGYHGTDGLPVADGLQPVSGQWSIAWNWTAGSWYGKHPTIFNLPPPIHPLTNLNQGKAYWLKVNETYAPSYGIWDASVWDNCVWDQ